MRTHRRVHNRKLIVAHVVPLDQQHTVFVQTQGEYHMYVAQTPHIDPLMFHLALQQNAETDAVDGAEKTAFAW